MFLCTFSAFINVNISYIIIQRRNFKQSILIIMYAFTIYRTKLFYSYEHGNYLCTRDHKFASLYSIIINRKLNRSNKKNTFSAAQVRFNMKKSEIYQNWWKNSLNFIEEVLIILRKIVDWIILRCNKTTDFAQSKNSCFLSS